MKKIKGNKEQTQRKTKSINRSLVNLFIQSGKSDIVICSLDIFTHSYYFGTKSTPLVALSLLSNLLTNRFSFSSFNFCLFFSFPFSISLLWKPSTHIFDNIWLKKLRIFSGFKSKSGKWCLGLYPFQTILSWCCVGLFQTTKRPCKNIVCMYLNRERWILEQWCPSFLL